MIAINLGNLIPRLTRSKTADQALQVPDNLTLPTDKPREGELVLSPTGTSKEVAKPDNSSSEKQKKLESSMMRALIAGHSQETSDKITELPNMSGKRNLEDLSGRNGQGDANKGTFQAQEVTDTNILLPAITGKIKPGAQNNETGYVPSAGNQGSSIGEGLAKIKPVLISTGVISETDEPEAGATAEKQINLRSRMMISKTESQAQEASEHSKFSKFKPGK
eukprot:7142236-Ditylum_brightwellii.AAC.1